MSSRDIAEAAAKAKERKKLLKIPVPMRPDAPENITLSKKEFIAKRKAEKEEDAKVAEFKLKLKSEKNAPIPEKEEAKDGMQEEGKKEKVVKKGRPKKIED
jgi:hypothetical protein